ncbi:MAG: DUF3592 domain-containing protein [Chloroflexi bacterium]|nr:DUF3592 domain-containing protein [Chloroflexota bacterium]
MKKFFNISTVLGLILMLIAGYLYTREVSFLKTAETVTGRVVDLQYSSSSDGGGSYCPVIDFDTKAGEPVRYYGNVCTAPPAYDIGDRVDVVYDPANIKHVALDSFWSKYLGAFVLTVIGLPFLILGIWLGFQVKK